MATDLARLQLKMTERYDGVRDRVLDTEVLMLVSEPMTGEYLLRVERLGYVFRLPTDEEIGTAVAAEAFVQRDLPEVFFKIGDKLRGYRDPLALAAMPHVSESFPGDSLLKEVMRQGYMRASS